MAQTSARIRDDEAPAMEIQHTEWAGPPSSRVQESLGHAPIEDQPVDTQEPSVNVGEQEAALIQHERWATAVEQPAVRRRKAAPVAARPAGCAFKVAPKSLPMRSPAPTLPSNS